MIPPASNPIRWRIVLLLMALCFISHLNRVSMSVAGNSRIMPQHGFSPTEMGAVYSAFLLVYTVFMIPSGFFIDRFGPRVALMVMGFGSAVFGAMTGGVGLAFSAGGGLLMALIGVRGLMGLLTTPLHPACARAVDHWTPFPRRSLANGLVTGAALLGIACTYRVFGALIARFDWPMAFVLCAIVTALLTFLWGWQTRHASRPIASVAREAESRSANAREPAWMSLLRNRSLILLTLSYAAVGYFQYLFFYWMQYYFEQVLQLGKSRSEFFASLPPLAMAVGMPLGGLIADRLQRRFGDGRGRVIVPVTGLMLSAVFLGLGIFGKTPVAIVVWFSLALGAMGASEGPFWTAAVELGGKRGGISAAIMNFGGNLGGMFAPVVTPWISGLFGWPVGIGLGGLICVAGALCWLGIKPGANGRQIDAPDLAGSPT